MVTREKSCEVGGSSKDCIPSDVGYLLLGSKYCALEHDEKKNYLDL